ncbi:MAG TPA: alpha-E domain-containing protein [Solirubrobacteraceae bacterium]|nr:alpha-E domain-containing protein [Solirubrobacteraceae bacterium]
MLARIAQELFWLGRDLARAEHTARMLDGVFHADVAGAAGERDIALSWAELLAIIGEKPPGPAAAIDTGTTSEFEALTAEAVARRPLGRAVVASLLTLDTDSQASIVSCVARARERGHGLRDVMSTEMWEALNTFHLGLAGRDLSAALVSGPYSVYHDVKEGCALFWGLVARTMLRDEGHSFLEAGGRIEAADMVLRLLRVAVPPEPKRSGSEGEALALLHAVGGFQAYRRAVRAAPTVGPVARFLLYDSSYPGSVASSVAALHMALSTADALPRSSSPVLRLGRLLADLELQRRAPDADARFDETLERVQEDLELVDSDIEDRYFAMAAVAAVHL